MNYDDFGLRIEYVEYTVKKGDSLYTIAQKYNTTVSALTDINMLTSNTIFPDQVLLIPKYSNLDPILIGLYNDFANYKLLNGQTIKIPRNNTYTMKDSDTVDTLLASTNRTADEILRANASNWLKSGSRVNL